MKYILGVVFLILGIIGVIFPIIPGIPFLVVSGFLFGFITEEKLLSVLKKLKSKENKDSKINKLINFVIIKFIHKKNLIS